MRTFKKVFFKERENAERFNELYCNGKNYIDKSDYFDVKYYGEKIKGMFYLTIRRDDEEMDELKKMIGLKEKRWNHKKLYVYE